MSRDPSRIPFSPITKIDVLLMAEGFAQINQPSLLGQSTDLQDYQLQCRTVYDAVLACCVNRVGEQSLIATSGHVLPKA